MKKEELRRLRTLNATPKMMKMAAEDKIQERTRTLVWGTAYKVMRYRYGVYLRCQVLNGLLKVAFFLTEHMKMGANSPVYELFINKETGDFLTYDRMKDKWLTAKLDMLEWPTYAVADTWINPEGSKSIKRYLDVKRGGYEGILEYQRQVRADQLKQRHKKVMDVWDLDLEQTPELPGDWGRWADKVGIPDNYIFYQYKRGGADKGYCTYCEKEVPIHKPRHNKAAACPCCRHAVLMKSEGKAGTVHTETAYMYLIQRCKDGFMIREFEGSRTYKAGEYRSRPDIQCHELRRAVYDGQGAPLKAYYWGQYKNKYIRWIKGDVCGTAPLWYTESFSGRVYGKLLPSLARKELKQTGLPEAIRDLGEIDPERYLAVLKAFPRMEQLAKAGLPSLLRECINNYRPFEKCFSAGTGSLKKMLGIDSQGLARLRKNNGGSPFLEWLRFEKMAGNPIPDHVIAWFCKEKISADELKFIMDRMSMVQVYNYMKKQMNESGMRSREVLTTWKDYLSMAKRFHMDTDDAIIYRARKLRQRHDELVERCHRKDLGIQAGEILQRFPHIEEIFRSLKEKYGYADEQYTVLAPASIEDILLEGEALHHCVGSSERYWERIESQESYILFLRRSSDVGNPYYTLEVEPDGTVRQKRTKYDRQEADIEGAARFLKKWQKEVCKRLSGSEQALAEKSRRLREKEFEQLRKDQVIIRTGHLAGKALVDVLMEDLMQNEEAASAFAEAA